MSNKASVSYGGVTLYASDWGRGDVSSAAVKPNFHYNDFLV